MAGRKLNTPGVTETTPDQEQTLNTEPDQSTSENQSTGEVLGDDRLDQILENQAIIKNQLEQLLKAGGVEVQKSKRWVQGKNGLEHKEI